MSENEIVELLTCENFDDSTEDLNTSEDGIRIFLNEILDKLIKCGRNVKWKNVTAQELYIHKLARAESISQNFDQ